MPQIPSRQFETFGDGLLAVCEADERKITRTKMEHIRFGKPDGGSAALLAGEDRRKQSEQAAGSTSICAGNRFDRGQ